jgi:hypothetical protein
MASAMPRNAPALTNALKRVRGPDHIRPPWLTLEPSISNLFVPFETNAHFVREIFSNISITSFSLSGPIDSAGLFYNFVTFQRNKAVQTVLLHSGWPDL